jgi:hypothetical protein
MMMNNSTFITSELLNPFEPGLTWKVAAVGNFDEDPQMDLAFQNTETGGLAIWHMRGLNAPQRVAVLPTALPNDPDFVVSAPK